MQIGILAHVRVLEVDNLEYDHHHGIRTTELTLEVNPEIDIPYPVNLL